MCDCREGREGGSVCNSRGGQGVCVIVEGGREREGGREGGREYNYTRDCREGGRKGESVHW